MKLKTLKPRLQTTAGRVAVMQPGSWRTDRTSSTQRGYGYAWQQARDGYLRSHPFCVYCLREYGIPFTSIAEVVLKCAAAGLAPPYASIVDHITPHRGDQVLFWNKANWQSMCVPHHSSTKQREEMSDGAEQWRRRS